MLEITINIQAPELSNAIRELAAAMGAKAQLVTSPPTLTGIPGGASIQQHSANVYTGPPDPQLVNSATPMPQQVNTGTPDPAYESHVTSGPIMPPSIPPVAGATAPNLAPPAETGVPTTAPTYTMEQLAVAATQLMDSPGHSMTELTELLAQFGVQALTQLPKEQYGIFATHLRAKGARI